MWELWLVRWTTIRWGGEVNEIQQGHQGRMGVCVSCELYRPDQPANARKSGRIRERQETRAALREGEMGALGLGSSGPARYTGKTGCTFFSPHLPPHISTTHPTQTHFSPSASPLLVNPHRRPVAFSRRLSALIYFLSILLRLPRPTCSRLYANVHSATVPIIICHPPSMPGPGLVRSML